MLTQVVVGSLRSAARRCVATTLRRNIGMSAVVYQKVNMDPIQKAFVDKIHAYATKSKAAGGKLVEVTPEFEQQMKSDLLKIEKQYGATGKDMTKFPEFTFTDPELEKVDLGLTQEEIQAQMEAKTKTKLTEDVEEGGQDEENIPYFDKY
ncbi:ATP synthase-coupling factor 6, mitochondrial-like [Lineus longissimus]|uniref:ATP synthase-coupling factor 6, mitochondrial-like n=1 Tax=Lineus longissimus TaxID=88925 RepID=UPI002B4DD3DE